MTRVEAGLGYRFSRDAMAKVVYQHSEIEAGGAIPETRRPSLVAAQLSVAF